MLTNNRCSAECLGSLEFTRNAIDVGDPQLLALVALAALGTTGHTFDAALDFVKRPNRTTARMFSRYALLCDEPLFNKKLGRR